MLNSSRFPSMPADTARAMEGVLGARNLYRVIGDEAESLFRAYVDARLGARSPVATVLSFRYALVTVFQFLESLADAGAAEASRIRGDWKYALRLPLSFPGFKASELCAFRSAILRREDGSQVFAEIMQWLHNHPQLLAGGDVEIDPGENIGAAVCRISALAWIFDAMCRALAALAAEQADWLRTTIQPAWYGRYAQSAMTRLPWDSTAQLQLAQSIAADIDLLVQAVDRDGRAELARLPEVQQLRQVLHRYEQSGDLGQPPLNCAYCVARIGLDL
jgi:transposase